MNNEPTRQKNMQTSMSTRPMAPAAPNSCTNNWIAWASLMLSSALAVTPDEAQLAAHITAMIEMRTVMTMAMMVPMIRLTSRFMPKMRMMPPVSWRNIFQILPNWNPADRRSYTDARMQPIHARITMNSDPNQPTR